MKRNLVKAAAIVPAIAAVLFSVGTVTPDEAYKDTSLSFGERAAHLVSLMTLDEKIDQLNNRRDGIPRLGLGYYNFSNEAQHGVNPTAWESGWDHRDTRRYNSTNFPSEMAMACTWNIDLMRQIGTAVSDEVRGIRALGPNEHGNVKALYTFGPIVEVCRDIGWGRADNTFGEDPFLTAEMASNFVSAMQGEGDGIPYNKLSVSAQHFMANNHETGEADPERNSVGRHGDSANMDQKTLREYYAYPWKALSENTQLESVMAAYNAVNGIPCHNDPYLLTTLLRETWGFQGFVISDGGALPNAYVPKDGNDKDKYGDIYGKRGHMWRPGGLTAPWVDANGVITPVGTAASALLAGMDFDNGADVYSGGAATAKDQGLKDAFDKGLITEADIDHALTRVFVARFKTGEFDPPELVAYTKITPGVVESEEHLELSLAASRQTPVLLKNAKNKKTGMAILPLDVKRYKSIAVIGALTDLFETGEHSPRATENYNLLEGIKKHFATEGYEDIVTFHDLGKLDIIYSAAQSNGNGSAAALNAKAAAKENVTKAVQAAKAADVVVLLVGTKYGLDMGYPDSNGFYWSGFGNAGEQFSDRKRNTGLPASQPVLMKKIAKANRNTILVMHAQAAQNITSFEKKFPGIIWSGYNGQYQGLALADILFGKVNPGGHLPFTWHKNDNDRPPIENYSLYPAGASKGRTYQFFKGGILYPFGYGLSYSDFVYTNGAISKSVVSPTDTIDVTVEVKNNSDRKGADVVQVYIAEPGAGKGKVPKKRLKGFARVELEANETKTVTIPIQIADLWIYDDGGNPSNKNGRIYVREGNYKVQISTDSNTVTFELPLEVKGTAEPGLKVVTARGDKVITNVNGTIKTALTLCLSDETFVKASDSGVTVVYESSNAAHAAVDANGVVTGISAGTALITAKVSRNGVAVCASYPVVVN